MPAPRPLPKSGLVLSPLGLGTAARSEGRGPDADVEAVTTVRQALDAGITYLDTAPHDGIGRAERRLATAVAGLPGRRPSCRPRWAS